MAGALIRERRKDQRAVTAAWMSARLQRAAKIPSLRELLRTEHPRRPLVAERLAALGQTLPMITMDEWRARHG